MARWQTRKTAGFEDMPEHLRHVDADSTPELKRARADWLEGAGLTTVDLLAWRRSRNPLARLRPPSRRKLMTGAELAALDAELEREGAVRW